MLSSFKLIPSVAAVLAASSMSLAPSLSAAADAQASGVFVPPPMGTVTVFHRVSSGSYGAVDGRIVWTHKEREWNGRKLVEAAATPGVTNLLEPDTFSIVMMLSPTGQPTMGFEPAVGFARPLVVGETWTRKHTVTQYPSGRKLPYEITYKVLALENVTVKAGTFKAFKVESSDSAGETATQWAVPGMGMNVLKRVLDRSATAPQGPGHLEGEAVSILRPPK